MKKYVLFYESADDVLAKAPLHFPAHRAHWDGFRSSGTLLLIGTFGDPREGAMAVFTSDAGGYTRSNPSFLNSGRKSTRAGSGAASCVCRFFSGSSPSAAADLHEKDAGASNIVTHVRHRML